jgi:hypothetical protein
MLRVDGLHLFKRFWLDERLQIPATFDQIVEYGCKRASIRLNERLWFAEAAPVVTVRP